MGQYWTVVNLDKKEYLNQYKLGCGAKLWEQLAGFGVGKALIILTANMPETRGGGDLDLEENWHGPERTFPEHNIIPAPMPERYEAIAKRTIGRWAGDRIAIIGDYANKGDLEGFDTPLIYNLCTDAEYRNDDYYKERGITEDMFYKDITDDVVVVIEHELDGKFEGEDWKTWNDNPRD